MIRRAENAKSAAQTVPVHDGYARMMAIALGVSGLGAALALYALPIFILVFGGLMPSIIALLLEERSGRHLTVTVVAFNGAGLMVSLEPLISNTLSGPAGYQIASAPETWFLMYGFALAGWALTWILPLFVSHGLDLIDRQRIRAIEQAREAIVKQWPSIAEGAAHDLVTEPVSATPKAGAAPRRRHSTDA